MPDAAKVQRVKRRGPRVDYTGRRFGWLTVIGFSDYRQKSRAFWWCRCDCGNTSVVCQPYLRTGRTQSCGCQRATLPTTHGESYSREYCVWKAIRQRCENPKNGAFRYYGARGISISPEWRDDFPRFLADMGRCPSGLTIERINNDGNYEPGNCRWATMAEQNRNKRPRGTA